ncbi:hypothetical protein R1sor_005289 [Riccia sorocarpa]|uniref:SAC3/GANP/THP3 conserved domain-containing protein n=1 Tax=Riccia sorocarpa TaxID=122646 RepID=A0ABD3HJ28_9MARC
MAGGASAQLLSISSYSQNQQQGVESGGSDSFLTPRGRNRSSRGGSNGGNSRDLPIESRGERRGGGGGKAGRGAWGSNFPDAGESRGFEGRGWASSPKGRLSTSKWGSGGGADSPDWRANRPAAVPENDSRSSNNPGRGRSFGSDRRDGKNYGKGSSNGSSFWSSDAPKRGSGRFTDAKDSLDSPKGKLGRSSSGKNLNRFNDAGRRSGRNLARLDSNSSIVDETRDSWNQNYSHQDARISEPVRYEDIPEFHPAAVDVPNEGDDGQEQEINDKPPSVPTSGLRIDVGVDDGNCSDGGEEVDAVAGEEVPMSTVPPTVPRIISDGNGSHDALPSPGRRFSIDSRAQSEDSPRTPLSQGGLRADAEEFKPETARLELGLIKIPQIASLRAEAAEFNPESPKDPATPMTRRSTDWYEICLEEEEEEDRLALANGSKRSEETTPGPQTSLSSPTVGGRGEFTRKKSGLSRSSSGRKLNDPSNNGAQSRKEFGRQSSFGGRSGNGKKRDDAFTSTPKRELRRSGSFGGRDIASNDSMVQSPKSTSRGARLGRNKSFNRDLSSDSPIPPSPGSAKGEFKPWNTSVREDALDSAQQSRSTALRNGESRSSSRGDKYVPLALRNKGRNEPSNLRPSSTDSPRGSYGSEKRGEENGRWRKGTDGPVITRSSPEVSAEDAEDSVNSVPVESSDQKKDSDSNNKTRGGGGVRSAAFFRAMNDASDGGAEEESLPHIVGTCADMCPVKERLQRERLRDLAVFERVNGDMKRTSKELAVKKFCRTVVASELSQSDIRPLPVLWRTLQYLLGLLDDPEFPFDIVHNFLFDRTRAIRQELGMQRILDPLSITIHEEVVRFHILSQHELRELNRQRSKQIDTYLNLQQLSKSLYSLLNLYIAVGGEEEAQFENEAEFYAYYVLLNLGNHGQFQAENLSLWLPSVPSRVLHSPHVEFARKVLRCYRSNNFVGFFRLVKEATYLQACLMELSFDSLRATSLAMLNVAEYKLHPFPLLELGQLLLLEETQAEELCTYYGLLTGFEKDGEKRCLFVKQSQFKEPERSSIPYHSSPLIDSKRSPSVFEQVKGQKVES